MREHFLLGLVVLLILGGESLVEVIAKLFGG